VGKIDVQWAAAPDLEERSSLWQGSEHSIPIAGDDNQSHQSSPKILHAESERLPSAVLVMRNIVQGSGEIRIVGYGKISVVSARRISI